MKEINKRDINDKKIGYWEGYFNNGNLICKGNFINDKKTGYSTFNSTTNLWSPVTYYSNSLTQSSIAFTDDLSMIFYANTDTRYSTKNSDGTYSSVTLIPASISGKEKYLNMLLSYDETTLYMFINRQ